MAFTRILPEDPLSKLQSLDFIKELHEQTKIYLKEQESRHLDYQQINRILQAQIQLEKRFVDQEQHRAKQKGRGGNNIAENVKKSVLAIIRNMLPKEISEQLHERFIKPYSLKSQKENIVLFFLFLHIFIKEKKISQKKVELVREQLNRKIDTYIENSFNRLEVEQQRKQFHQKNIREFQKFRNLDLDFTRERKYSEVAAQVSNFYMKKKVQADRAEERVRKIIKNHPQLLQIFPDLNEEKSMPIEKKEETISCESDCSK